MALIQELLKPEAEASFYLWTMVYKNYQLHVEVKLFPQKNCKEKLPN